MGIVFYMRNIILLGSTTKKNTTQVYRIWGTIGLGVHRLGGPPHPLIVKIRDNGDYIRVLLIHRVRVEGLGYSVQGLGLQLRTEYIVT